MDDRLIIFPEEPKFQTKLSPKAYRESAIMWQVKALQAQTEAVSSIAAEHGIKLDDISPRALSQRAEDLVATAMHIVHDAAKAPVDKTFDLIKILRSSADELRSDAALFVKVADFRAAFRLSGTLPTMAETISTGVAMLPKADAAEEEEPKEDRDALCCDHRKLMVASARRCYQAESQQHHTFSLQINAICDLAMEMVLAAAAEKTESEGSKS